MARIARRDLLKVLGGGAAGLFLTPVPWKLIDDTAKWTQNWRWIPRTPRGEVKVRYTNCTLCPAGCAVRARCVGDYPISLSGVAAHPLSRGALCPLGIAGHHLGFHPARLHAPVRRSPANGASGFERTTPDAAMREVAGAIAETRRAGRGIAVVDEAPGRVVSAAYREFAARIGQGFYVAPAREDESLEALSRSFEKPPRALGVDIENARMVVSFGAPLLENWSTPGRSAALLAARTTRPAADRTRIVQVDPVLSATATLADRWLAIQPATEASLALGLAHVLIRDRLYDEASVRRALDFDGAAGFRARVAACTPDRTRSITGIGEEVIVAVAHEMAAGRPAVAIGGTAGAPLGSDAASGVAALNLLLGSVGAPGGIVARNGALEAPAPPPDTAESIPDRSLGVLILGDATSGNSVGWPQLENKLADGAIVVSLSPFLEGIARHADVCLPAAGYLYASCDVPAAPASPFATFSVATPLMPPPAGAVDPVAFIYELASQSKLAGQFPAGSEDALRRRASAIFNGGRGRVIAYASGEATPLKSVKTAEDFWKMLSDGACWADDEAEPSRPAAFARYRFLAGQPVPGSPASDDPPGGYPLAVVSAAPPYGGSEAVCPLMTKLYRESDLRLSAGTVALHPATAASRGIAEGDRVVVEAPRSSRPAVAHLDAGVRPGVLRSAVRGGAGRKQSPVTSAQIRKAEHA